MNTLGGMMIPRAALRATSTPTPAQRRSACAVCTRSIWPYARPSGGRTPGRARRHADHLSNSRERRRRLLNPAATRMRVLGDNLICCDQLLEV